MRALLIYDSRWNNILPWCSTFIHEFPARLRQGPCNHLMHVVVFVPCQSSTEDHVGLLTLQLNVLFVNFTVGSEVDGIIGAFVIDTGVFPHDYGLIAVPTALEVKMLWLVNASVGYGVIGIVHHRDSLIIRGLEPLQFESD